MKTIDCLLHRDRLGSNIPALFAPINAFFGMPWSTLRMFTSRLCWRSNIARLFGARVGGENTLMVDPAASDARSVRLVSADHIDSRIRILRYGTLVDAFAVVTRNHVVLIDTMVSAAVAGQMIDLLRSDLRDKQLLVVNSHADWDHVLGNGYFTGPNAFYPAPVIAHWLSESRMRSSESQETLAALRLESPKEVEDSEWHVPTIRFEGKLVIDGGDLTLQLFPTPGHQLDHICVWIPEIRLLLAGDAAELPFPSVSDWQTLPQLRETLADLYALSPEHVLCCHAPNVSDPEVIRANILYFDELERRCRVVAAAGSLPMDVDSLPEPARTIGWPIEDAVPAMMPLNGPSSDEAETAANRCAELFAVWSIPEAHDIAIRAMLHWVRSHTG
jgi:glyoxylase-like metal-dependent hydrolase (beta-lactamase superfamily II)